MAFLRRRNGGGDGQPPEGAQPPAELAAQAKEEMMSLGGPVRWRGADSSPRPTENVTAAIMPCSLQLEVCRFIAASFREAARAIGWRARVLDGQSDPTTEQRVVDAALNDGVDCIGTFAAAVRVARSLPCLRISSRTCSGVMLFCRAKKFTS